MPLNEQTKNVHITKRNVQQQTKWSQVANENQNNYHCDKLYETQAKPAEECLNACNLIAKFNLISI